MRKQYTGIDNVRIWKGHKYGYLHDFNCCVNIYVQDIVTKREERLRIITGAKCNAVINLQTANGTIDTCFNVNTEFDTELLQHWQTELHSLEGVWFADTKHFPHFGNT
jgi:hypothetical protein